MFTKISGGSRSGAAVSSGGGGEPGGRASPPWLASLVLSLRRGLMGAKKCLGLLSACCVAFVVIATVSMVPLPLPIGGVLGTFIATLGNACSGVVGTKVVSVGGGGGGEREGGVGLEYLRCENGDCKL